jgi:hypothetical protein
MVRLVNPTPHKPTIYPAMKLPTMVSVPLQPTVAPSRPGSMPTFPGNNGPAVRAPQVK